jgi:protoporphyrinogen oxidase
MVSTSKKVVVIGGGLAGLSSALLLLRKGFQVTIIEKSSELGGLAITRSKDGFKWDLGPHNIHTHHTDVLGFLERTFSDMYEHALPSLVYKGGKLLNYPLKGLRILTSLPPVRLLQAAVSFFVARLRMLLTEPKRDGTFEDWIKNRFGGVLFEEYFHHYPRKVWGLNTREIDKYVAEKRVPVISFLELIRTLILRKAPRMDHPEWSSKNYYLPDGIGEIANHLSSEFINGGGQVLFSSQPESLIVENSSVTGVVVSSDSGERKEVACDYCLSTIPVNDFVRLFPECPETVLTAASGLDYVASVLLFLKTRRADVLPAKLLYFSEPTLQYSRLSDVGAFSRKMVPEGQNLLCLEFPCTVGDGTWNKSLEDLTEHASRTLVERKILKEGDVYESFMERISHSYPRFRTGFQERRKICTTFVATHKNSLSFGRQGGFAYVNTDAVLHQGFKAAASVVMAESLAFSVSEWFERV